MAIIKLLSNETIEVKETGEQVAAQSRRESPMVRLTDLDDFGGTPVWVNIAAIAAFTDSSAG